MSKIITANLLTTGRVVYLGQDNAWVGSIDQARDFDDATAEVGLVMAQRDQQRAVIVDPFIVDKGPAQDGRAKMTLRDTIRAYGPTIRV